MPSSPKQVPREVSRLPARPATGAWYCSAVPGPFDTTTKYLVQTYPTDWVAFVGLGDLTMPQPVEVVDANLSAVSAEADKVVRVGDADPWLVHLEFQSTYDPTMGQRLVRYSSMLHLQHQIPVASVLVLLRPEADGAAIDGEYRMGLPGASRTCGSSTRCGGSGRSRPVRC